MKMYIEETENGISLVKLFDFNPSIKFQILNILPGQFQLKDYSIRFKIFHIKENFLKLINSLELIVGKNNILINSKQRSNFLFLI
jgi:hypothetical protein